MDVGVLCGTGNLRDPRPTGSLSLFGVRQILGLVPLSGSTGEDRGEDRSRGTDETRWGRTGGDGQVDSRHSVPDPDRFPVPRTLDELWYGVCEEAGLPVGISVWGWDSGVTVVAGQESRSVTVRLWARWTRLQVRFVRSRSTTVGRVHVCNRLSKGPHRVCTILAPTTGVGSHVKAH